MKLWLTYWLLVFLFYNASAQTRGDVRIMFYNTENLFDTWNDPQTNDEDFTPAGRMHWTREKYQHKLLNIYKVIAATGEWSPPEIIGLAEVENRMVLKDLLKSTPLSEINYKIVHYDSPDPRGIDAALLYRSDRLRLLQQKPIPVKLTEKPEWNTRYIIMAKLIFKETDTLNIFVNHWPSRRGGEMETRHLRIRAANVLREEINTLLSTEPHSKIIILGDFNDGPQDLSIRKYLNAQPVQASIDNDRLYNLSSDFSKTSHVGTLYFQGQWSIFDQIIVSGWLLSSGKGLITKPFHAHIFSPEFLLQPDEKNINVKPLPTFSGRRYVGGYSDHLPVYLDLFLNHIKTQVSSSTPLNPP
jgi:predicted extracellular nuclease